MFGRILVPLDGSKPSEQVFPWVVDLARAFGSDVILTEVCAPSESKDEPVIQAYLDNKAEQLRSKIGADALRKPRAVVLVGQPASEIIDYTEKNDIDLLIMASHGHSGIVPWSLGSTTYKVLQKVAVPSIVVRARVVLDEEENDRLFNRIVVPLDGSEKAEVVLPYVIEFMDKLKSEADLLQIIASGKHVHSIGGLSYVDFKDIDTDVMKTNAKEYLNQVCNRLPGIKGKVRCEIRVGDPVKETVKYANETGSHLIAMASHGHSYIEMWTWGSVAYKILLSSDQAVLLFNSVI